MLVLCALYLFLFIIFYFLFKISIFLFIIFFCFLVLNCKCSLCKSNSLYKRNYPIVVWEILFVFIEANPEKFWIPTVVEE